MYMYTKQGHVHGIALYSYHTNRVPNQKLKLLDCPNMLIMDYNSLNLLVIFFTCVQVTTSLVKSILKLPKFQPYIWGNVGKFCHLSRPIKIIHFSIIFSQVYSKSFDSIIIVDQHRKSRKSRTCTFILSNKLTSGTKQSCCPKLP